MHREQVAANAAHHRLDDGKYCIGGDGGVVADDQVQTAIDAIVKVARTGQIGDGKITVFTLDEVVPLVQDAMFSRAPSAALRTGIFFAGRDAVLARLHAHVEQGERLFPAIASSAMLIPSWAVASGSEAIREVEQLAQASLSDAEDTLVQLRIKIDDAGTKQRCVVERYQR